MTYVMTYVWKQTILVLLVGFSIVTLAGYASAQSPPDVTGTWVGNTVRGSTTMTMVLKQTGNRVTGTIQGIGTGDGPVDGTIQGDTIRLRFDKDTEQTPTLNIKENQIAGMLSGTEVTFRRVGKSQ